MATMGKSKFLLSKSKERFRGRARSMRRGVGDDKNMLSRSPGNGAIEDNNSSNELSSSTTSPVPQQQPSFSNQQYQQLQYFNDQAMSYTQNSQGTQYGQQQPQIFQYSQNQPPELQYIQTLQYVRQDELQLQQWNQAQREQLDRQGGGLGSDETSLAYSHQTYGQNQPMVSENMIPVDEQALQQLLQRQQYEHEQAQVRMRQEQMFQQEQLRWQHQQLREQQEKLRQQKQARQKQELHIHQQQMRQQQQIRNQKMQHQQRRQHQMQQQQHVPEQQQSVEEEAVREQFKQQDQYKQKTQKEHQVQPQQHQLIKHLFVEEDNQEKKERPIKIRRRCWQRQQKLLDMQDDWESLYELENTIKRPTSKRNPSAATFPDPLSVYDTSGQYVGIPLNIGSIADALGLLDVASRLQVPEHLAETLTKLAMLTQEDQEYDVRHAIAIRQEPKNVEDFAAVNRSMSVGTCSTGYTGNANFSHGRQDTDDWSPNVYKTFPEKSYTKKREHRKLFTSTSTSASSDKSHSVGPGSTMTSQRDIFDKSNRGAASISTAGENESYKPQLTEQKSGSFSRQDQKTKSELDAVSANLQGLTVSVSYEDDQDEDDASDVAITPQHTGISSRKAETIESKESASSRSHKQNSKQPHSSGSKRQLESHNVPSVQETMTIDGTLTTPSTFDIKHIGSGQASAGLSALSYPTAQAHAEDDTTYPSLQPTDAFTISSRKLKSSARAPSRKGHSPSPSSVLMSYTLSETEESVTSMRRNHKSNNSITGAPPNKSRRSLSVKKSRAQAICKSKSSKSQRESKTSSKENGTSKSSKIQQDSLSRNSTKTGPREREHASIGQQQEYEQDYESYATSNAPIQPADSRRNYTTSRSYSSDLEKDPNILFASEEGPIQSDDDVTVRTGTSDRFAADIRTTRDDYFPDVEYDLSRPLSSEYDDTSFVDSEVREKPSSPRRHPAMADYEASNRMLQEEESLYSNRSLVSGEQSSYLSSYRPRKKRDDVLFSNRNSIKKRQSLDSWSKSNNVNPDTIRTAYATMTQALRPDKHKRQLVSGERHLNIVPQFSGCALQYERKNEDEDDLDQWLESAMATKSFDDGCALDARQFGEADDGDLDAWLDNVICG